MTDNAFYHRTFSHYQAPRAGLLDGMAWGLGHGHIALAYRSQHAKDNSYSASQYRGDDFAPLRISARADQNFTRFATNFERQFSVLCSGSMKWADPVVDHNLTVVAHIATVSSSNLYVQQGKEVGSDLLADGKPIIIARSNPDMHRYMSLNHGITRFVLLVDEDGQILRELSRYEPDQSIRSVNVSPLDLILIPKTLIAGAGGLIFSLARKKATQSIASTAAGGGARRTSPGMGAVGPGQTGAGAAGTAAGSVTPRLVGRRLELTVDEMGNYLAPLFKSHPELTHLMKARHLTGDALKKQVDDVLAKWAQAPGRSVQIVETGAVQRLTGEAGNFASMRGNTLMIERQVLNSPAKYYEEAVHELATRALGGRVQKIYVAGNERWHAQMILEGWISRTGSFDYFRQMLAH